MADLEEQLRSHAQAFDGLLSLIPAKYYYAEDNSDQWQRKKQTKEEARNAKRAKLDPDSAKTAKDVMNENARKRKRDSDDESQPSEGELGSELPKEKLTRRDAQIKKQKQQSDSVEKEKNAQTKSLEVEERRRLKAEKKAEKQAAQREKKKAKDAARKERAQEAQNQSHKSVDTSQQSSQLESEQSKDKNQQNSSAKDNDDEEEDVASMGEFSLDPNIELPEDASTASSNRDSPGFDASNNNSGSSSISSIVPPADGPKSIQQSESKPLKATPEEPRQRLQKRLDELRAARHADGLNGKPARNRQELIEARRQKAEQRKAHKKELRERAKEEEQRRKDEDMTRRFSPGGSGSLLASPRSPAESNASISNNYSFGRVAFADGQHADPSLSRLLDDKHHRRQDPGTALKAAEAKKSRLATLEHAKRVEIEEKDMWLNTKKRAHGERVRDDTSLLKKALKRKESAKKKSEREWKERIEGVNKGKEMRQQKRDENIRKRKEDRSGGGKVRGAGKGKAKPRPGFEGSFKTKVGGKKK